MMRSSIPVVTCLQLVEQPVDAIMTQKQDQHLTIEFRAALNSTAN